MRMQAAKPGENLNGWAWALVLMSIVLPPAALGAIGLGIAANRASEGRVGASAALAGFVMIVLTAVAGVFLYVMLVR